MADEGFKRKLTAILSADAVGLLVSALGRSKKEIIEMSSTIPNRL